MTGKCLEIHQPFLFQPELIDSQNYVPTLTLALVSCNLLSLHQEEAEDTSFWWRAPSSHYNFPNAPRHTAERDMAKSRTKTLQEKKRSIWRQQNPSRIIKYTVPVVKNFGTHAHTHTNGIRSFARSPVFGPLLLPSSVSTQERSWRSPWYGRESSACVLVRFLPKEDTTSPFLRTSDPLRPSLVLSDESPNQSVSLTLVWGSPTNTLPGITAVVLYYPHGVPNPLERIIPKWVQGKNRFILRFWVPFLNRVFLSWLCEFWKLWLFKQKYYKFCIWVPWGRPKRKAETLEGKNLCFNSPIIANQTK